MGKTFLRRALGLAVWMGPFLVWGTAFGACHVVTPSGSGSQTGLDWNTAFAKLPASLTSGDVYYLADGSYGIYNVTTSGATIRKAQTGDHCSDTGWNAATMGSSQAVFTKITFAPGSANNVTFDGNGSSTSQGCGGIPLTIGAAPLAPSDCGIKVDDSGCSSSTADACDNVITLGQYNQTAVTGLVFRYMEWLGNDNITSEQQFFYALQASSGGQGFRIDHVFGHKTGCVWIKQYGGSHTVSNSYWWGNHSSPSICHGQYGYLDMSSVTEFNNVYRDIEGSAVWFVDSLAATTWNLYNNVIFYSASYPTGHTPGTNGVLDFGNSGAGCTNCQFNQNVIANQYGGYDAGIAQVGGATGSMAGSTASNNIWFSNVGENISMAFTPNHNSYLNNQNGGTCGSYCTQSDGGTGVVVKNGAGASPIPFVNWTAGNFQVATENANWTGGATLLSPYNIDPAGTLRGSSGSWDRGVYQCVGTRPNPPTSLTATPH